MENEEIKLDVQPSEVAKPKKVKKVKEEEKNPIKWYWIVFSGFVFFSVFYTAFFFFFYLR